MNITILKQSLLKDYTRGINIEQVVNLYLNKAFELGFNEGVKYEQDKNK